MPKKNSKAKKTVSKERSKNAIHADIAKAVDRIAEEMQRTTLPIAKTKNVATTTPETPIQTVPSYRNQRTLLWTGVTIMTTIIFVMWVWNAKAMFYDIQHNKSAEAMLLANAKDDIENILAQSPPKPEIFETAKPIVTQPDEPSNEAIKQTLQALFAGAATTSSAEAINIKP